MTIDADIKTVVELGVIVANVMLAFSTQKVKTEILALKVWILENFHAKEKVS